MYVEHVVYSLAFAIFAVLLLKPKEAGLCTLVVVISGCIPDIDGLFDLVRHPPTFTDYIVPHMTEHLRYFHSIGVLVLYAAIAGIILYRLNGLSVFTGAFFAGFGFALHLFEDALVYNPSSAIFWPFSSTEVGLGWLPHARDFFTVANGEVLLVGMVLLASAVGLSLLARDMTWTELPSLGWFPERVAVPVPDDEMD
jgi:membrane-bound metal-dependent hydrolase YbcI (DUF457 family)